MLNSRKKIDLCNLLSSSDTGLNDLLIRSIVGRNDACLTNYYIAAIRSVVKTVDRIYWRIERLYCSYDDDDDDDDDVAIIVLA